MLWNRSSTLLFYRSVVLGIAFTVFPFSVYAADELEQYLRDKYDDKTFVLREFYPGERLKYDSAGMSTGSAVPGDWTVNGFVHVTSLSLSGQRLKIKTDRLLLLNSGQIFGFATIQQSGSKKKEKATRASGLQIEVEFDPTGITAEKADSALSKIFLTAQDRIAYLVPDYWKPCVLAASTGVGRKEYIACGFLPEFAAIPGVISNSDDHAESVHSYDGEVKASDLGVVPMGTGVTPPRCLSCVDPDYSTEARELGYRGAVGLLFVVDKTGQVRNIRVLRPLGLGLERKAVESLRKWQFSPAEKDGQPVAVELRTQMNFHLY
jgi:TonB family protein